MSKGSRRIPLDLALSVYEVIELHAQNQDLGVQDLARRILISWANEHPVEDDESPPSDT